MMIESEGNALLTDAKQIACGNKGSCEAQKCPNVRSVPSHELGTIWYDPAACTLYSNEDHLFDRESWS